MLTNNEKELTDTVVALIMESNGLSITELESRLQEANIHFGRDELRSVVWRLTAADTFCITPESRIIAKNKVKVVPRGFNWMLETIEYSNVLDDDCVVLVELQAKNQDEAELEALELIKGQNVKRARLYYVKLNKEFSLAEMACSGG